MLWGTGRHTFDAGAIILEIAALKLHLRPYLEPKSMLPQILNTKPSAKSIIRPDRSGPVARKP